MSLAWRPCWRIWLHFSLADLEDRDDSEVAEGKRAIFCKRAIQYWQNGQTRNSLQTRNSVLMRKIGKRAILCKRAIQCLWENGQTRNSVLMRKRAVPFDATRCLFQLINGTKYACFSLIGRMQFAMRHPRRVQFLSDDCICEKGSNATNASTCLPEL